MKKVFATVLGAALMLIGTQAFAQIGFGVGYINASDKTVATVSGTTKTDKADRNGFYVGFDYNLKIIAGLGVQTGLYADMLFSSSKDEYYIATGNARFTEIDLNIPLNLTYTFPLNRDFSLFIFGGPTFQYGVYKNYKYTTSATWTDKTATTTVDYYKDSGHKPFNIYLGGGAGFQAGNVQVRVGYDHSMMNMVDSDSYKLGRGQIKIGVGLSF